MTTSLMPGVVTEAPHSSLIRVVKVHFPGANLNRQLLGSKFKFLSMM